MRRVDANASPLARFRRNAAIEAAVAAAILGLIAFSVARDPSTSASVPALEAIGSILAARHLVRLCLAWRRIRQSHRRAARNIVGVRKQLFGDALHQYRMARLEEFPNLDQAFYEMCLSWFEARGFRLAGDVEDVTATNTKLAAPSVQRVFLDEDGLVMANVYHVTFPPRLGQKFTRVVRGIEFVTEFDDGTFVVTNNQKGPVIPTYPGIAAERFDAKTSPAVLLDRYRAAVAGARSLQSGIAVVAMRDVEAVIQSGHRCNAIKSRFKQSVAWDVEREVSAKRALNDNERAIAEEIRKLGRNGR